MRIIISTMAVQQEAVWKGIELVGRVSFGVIVGLVLALCSPAPGLAQDIAIVRIAYLSQVVERPPKLSNLELPPQDDGMRGGQLAIKDNNTTGRFMKQAFELHDVSVPPDCACAAALAGCERPRSP